MKEIRIKLIIAILVMGFMCWLIFDIFNHIKNQKQTMVYSQKEKTFKIYTNQLVDFDSYVVEDCEYKVAKLSDVNVNIVITKCLK
jgi:hypothetical protein